MAAESGKLRLLMLHGLRQNGKLFYERNGSFRKILKRYCEFVYCDAPNEVPKDVVFALSEKKPGNEEDEQKEEEDANVVLKGWFFKDKSPEENGFEKSLDYLNDVFKTQGPFDGVFGFSQGGSMLSVLCHIAEHNLNNNWPSSSFLANYAKYDAVKFKFCATFAGCKTLNETQLTPFYSLPPIKMPSLHVYGKADRIIVRERSIEYSTLFENPRIFEHELGHFIPTSPEAKQVYLSFIEGILDAKKSA